MSLIFAVSDAIVRAFLAIATLALLVMMLVIVGDVFMRYLFNAPITGTYDVVEMCLVTAVTFSMGAVISGSREIVIDLIDQIASDRTVVVLRRCAAFASAGILLFIFNSMITPAFQSYQYGEIRLELNMPVWISWALALVGVGGGVLASFVGVFRSASDTGRNQADQEPS